MATTDKDKNDRKKLLSEEPHPVGKWDGKNNSEEEEAEERRDQKDELTDPEDEVKRKSDPGEEDYVDYENLFMM